MVREPRQLVFVVTILLTMVKVPLVPQLTVPSSTACADIAVKTDENMAKVVARLAKKASFGSLSNSNHLRRPDVAWSWRLGEGNR